MTLYNFVKQLNEANYELLHDSYLLYAVSLLLFKNLHFIHKFEIFKINCFSAENHVTPKEKDAVSKTLLDSDTN